MLLPLSWLREFVPYEGSAEALADRLTMLGLELEEIAHPFAAIEGILVGRVVECTVHPNSDHMHICKVDIAQGELLNIVCGAPNVAAGQTVAVATVGTTMPDGLVIKKAKLRGEPSFGMICSERELGLSDDHEGIMVLPEGTPLGAKLVDVLKLERDVLDIDITANRADCLSILGLAREVAVAFDLPLTIPARPLVTAKIDAVHPSIEIDDPELCYSYCGRVISGVKIAKSPAALRYRLQAVGVRAINNVVDVTNYILMECGQPLHAFDLDLLRGGKIIVKSAGEGERFTTLDGQERTLCAKDLTIRDAEGAVALAGVMGGLDSEITQTSTKVFLESAAFRPASVRVTSRRLGLSSEASFRFERGIDQERVRFSLDRAAAMIADVAGGVVSEQLCENEPKPFVPAQIVYRPSRCAALLGEDPGKDFSKKILSSLGCPLSETNEDSWQVEQPSWRADLTREADLIEEVARYYGMDRIEPVLPPIERNLDDALQAESEFSFWSRIKRWGAGLGLNECINYSFVGQKDLNALGLPEEGRIAIINPLSAEQDVLRTELMPGMLNDLRNNLAQGIAGVRLFELAHVFHADETSYTGVRESGRICFLLSGSRFETAWPQPEADLDYLDLKGILENLFRFLHLGSMTVKQREVHPFFSPVIEVFAAETSLGFMGRIRPEIAERSNAHLPVWAAELDLEILWKLHQSACFSFQTLPVYPPVRRDITVAAPESMKVEEISWAIMGMNLPLLKEVVLVDVFTPEGEAVRKLSFRLTFRHADRTLRDAEVDKERDKVAAYLVKKLGVSI